MTAITFRVHPSQCFLKRSHSEAEAQIRWPLHVKNWLIRKYPDAGKDWRQEEKGMTEHGMVWWHHQLDGHEFEQAPGVGDGQGSLACCSPWSLRARHDWVTELNWTELFWGRWEGDSTTRGHMYTYGWFMLMFGRNQHTHTHTHTHTHKINFLKYGKRPCSVTNQGIFQGYRTGYISILKSLEIFDDWLTNV